MRHGDDRARVFLEEALEPGHGLGVEVVGGLVEQQQVGLLQQQPARARRGGARRRRALRTSASPGGSRSASIAISSVRSSSQAFAASMRSCSFACSSSSAVISSSSSGSANFARDRLEAVQQRARLGDALLDVAEHVLGRVELRLLRQEADADARRPAAPRRVNSVSTPAMMRSSVLLPAPFAPSTPIFAPGRKDSVISSRMTRSGGTTLRRSRIVKTNSGATRTFLASGRRGVYRCRSALVSRPSARASGRPGSRSDREGVRRSAILRHGLGTVTATATGWQGSRSPRRASRLALIVAEISRERSRPSRRRRRLRRRRRRRPTSRCSRSSARSTTRRTCAATGAASSSAPTASTLRGPEYASRPPPGVFRIAIGGDSFVMGLGVDEADTYPMQLERLLAADQRALRPQVLNVGLRHQHQSGGGPPRRSGEGLPPGSPGVRLHVQRHRGPQLPASFERRGRQGDRQLAPAFRRLALPAASPALAALGLAARGCSRRRRGPISMSWRRTTSRTSSPGGMSSSDSIASPRSRRRTASAATSSSTPRSASSAGSIPSSASTTGSRPPRASAGSASRSPSPISEAAARRTSGCGPSITTRTSRAMRSSHARSTTASASFPKRAGASRLRRPAPHREPWLACSTVRERRSADTLPGLERSQACPRWTRRSGTR